jgi:general secretion pathway protein E
MLILTDPVRSVVRESSVTPAAIRKAAGKKAFRTLYEDGIGKVAAGITTLDEVRRVLRTKSPNRGSKKSARQ